MRAMRYIPPRARRGQCARRCARRPESSKSRYKICIHEIFCAESFLPMRLQVSVIEFVRYSAMFLRTIDVGHIVVRIEKLDPYKSALLGLSIMYLHL